MLFEIMIYDESLSDAEKVRQALKLYYPVIPEDINEAVNKLIWFYRCGKEMKSSGNTGGKPSYSFEYDADYIYSAFSSQYGIDLQNIDYMHWWKFRAMFKSLKDDNEFVKIIGYRSIEITSKMSKEQKAYYKHMKDIHALPISSKEQEEDAALLEALQNGGDVSRLLGGG